MSTDIVNASECRWPDQPPTDEFSITLGQWYWVAYRNSSDFACVTNVINQEVNNGSHLRN